MAQTVIRTDDLDGSANAETIEFGLEGVTYSIDLSEANASELREQLAAWIGYARKVSGRAKAKSNGSNGSKPVDPATVRAWAKEQGLDVSERGRIVKTVWDAYLEAH